MKIILLLALLGYLESTSGAPPDSIRWCCVGRDETKKCDKWATNLDNTDAEGNTAIVCETEASLDACVKRIMSKNADAMTMDGGQVYSAGKCGLVPVMVEQYDQALCSTTEAASSYYAVAVVRKGTIKTWNELKGKRSCHTGYGKTAGWNVPMGHVHNETGSCDFSTFFTSGCAPGSNKSSSFCRNCQGSGGSDVDNRKCDPNANEIYYGYAGAFRCLAEGAGDVGFMKHTTVMENTDANRPTWAIGALSKLSKDDFELVCPPHSSTGTAPVDDAITGNCNLAKVPAHAVMAHPDARNRVVRVLQEQQSKFGPTGTSTIFRMFESDDGRNLLFKVATKCLNEVPAGQTYEAFLGNSYMLAMNSLRQCTDNTPELEKFCQLQQ